jgi:hypothetical protein
MRWFGIWANLDGGTEVRKPQAECGELRMGEGPHGPMQAVCPI